LKKEFPIEDEWLSFELHPETPLEGISIAKRFPGVDVDGMMAHLNNSGAPYGIRFGNLQRLSNSKLALQAGEFARDQGMFHEFHDRLFRAYFTEVLDIGRMDVLLGLSEETGLNTDDLKSALGNGKYLPRLAEAAQEARKQDVVAIPAFFFHNGTMGHRIGGAQPLAMFQEALRTLTT
jgi:predicted DsbA family dithiol-disulfide isomerase